MRFVAPRRGPLSRGLFATIAALAAAFVTVAPATAFDPWSIPKHKFKVVEEGRILELSGGFDDGIANAFDAAVAANPGVRIVRLTSDGGLVGEAILIARTIAMHGLTTHVKGTCSSACVVAFVAGSERWIDRKGRLGFHAWTGVGDAADTERSRKSQLELLVGIGVDRALVERATRVPAHDMWFPTLDELLAARAVTAIRPGIGGGRKPTRP